MKEEEKKLLTTFEIRLRQFFDVHDRLERERNKLEELLRKEKEENNRIAEELNRLKADYTNLKTATAISLNGSDVKETKLRLSKLVREVDKCIALLNE
ncbi:hypothetical protein LJC21_02715 [Bacteroides sp. OttesenSCG-928-E20]|nr:hypothetical protein [Bacteroides sp. OttesenSCG-928-E20]